MENIKVRLENIKKKYISFKGEILALKDINLLVGEK